MQLAIDQLLDILSQVDASSAFYAQAAEVLDTRLVVSDGPSIPRATPPNPPKKLTIGMATYDDYDGVYFSVQAIRLYHPEIADSIEILVIDNHPAGEAAEALKRLDQPLQGYRYVPAGFVQGTAVRDLIFREAAGEFVLCMDSHVFFPPGTLARLLDYLETHGDSRDLLQGPLLHDNLKSLATHLDPVWRQGMWGVWARDERGADPDAPSFEIPMQGLGVFACRRDAWPGLNPRLSGFGGEEGFLHEKFRRGGAKTLCLPFLRWVHRFGRPLGAPYPLGWESRIRNYLICFDELGLDPSPAIGHFEEILGAGKARGIVKAVEDELASPFHFFEAIYCINLNRAVERWKAVTEGFERLGIAARVRRFPAIETPTNHHIGCALSHRAIVAEAKQRGLKNVLVFEDDVIFSEDAVEDFRPSLSELKTVPWSSLHLGGHRWGRDLQKAPGCRHIEIARGVTCTHAIAYHESFFDRILKDVPETPTGVALWLRKVGGIDQYFARTAEGLHFITNPIIATQGSILGQETRRFGHNAD